MKKTHKIWMFSILAVLALGVVSAVVVNYLGNKVTAEVSVESPIEVYISASDTAGWSDTLDAGQIYSYETVDFYVDVKNLADVRIDPFIIRGIVSNENNNVDCDDITEVTMTDYWCHGYDSEKNTNLHGSDSPCPEQDISGLCVDKGSKVWYDIPADFLAGQGTVYPIGLTFNNVQPQSYSIEVQPVLQ